MSKKQKIWRSAQKRIRFQYENVEKRGILFFVASRGEFEQALPVIESIKSQFPNENIVVSFFSPSGYIPLKDHKLIDVALYTPFDTPSAVKEFVYELEPKIAIFVKYELWLNMMKELNASKIPLFLISGVFGGNHFLGKFFGKPWRNELQKFQEIYIQDNDSKEFLKSFDISSVIAGDTRIDRSLQLSGENDFDDNIHKKLNSNLIQLILGSVWQEDILLFLEIKDWIEENNIQLIIAPHELDENILSIQKDFDALLYHDDLPNKFDSHLIINKMGVLKYIYRYADIVYIGGGFGKGIHNTLEPASYSKPVLFGPNHEKFVEARLLQEYGGAFSIKNGDELKSRLQELLDENKRIKAGQSSKQYLEDHKGATKILMNNLKQYFN